MTEQQIKDGYDRLDAALAPPMDALARVDRRVTARRRVRRTTVAGASALGVLAATGFVVGVFGGEDGDAGPQVANDVPGPVSTLVMTRPDGSTVAFPDVTVTCEKPRTDAGDPGGAEPGWIWMYSPMDFTGSEKDEDVVLHKPFIYFEGEVDKLQGGQTFQIRTNGPGDAPTYPMVLFMADPRAGQRANEVSSNAFGTNGTNGAGTVRVVRATCEPNPVLELEVDATLASEIRGGDALAVEGALR